MLLRLLQYRNPGNPLAHYDTTAEEIITQCGGKVREPFSSQKLYYSMASLIRMRYTYLDERLFYLG